MAKPAEKAAEERLREAVADFGRDPDAARKSLKQLIVEEPEGFRAAALPALRSLADDPARGWLIDLMAEAGWLPACDPTVLPLDEEIALARLLAARDDSLDLKLARRLSGGAALMNADAMLRTLAVLAAVATGGRVLPLLIRLLHHPDARVRSKAALLIGRPDMAPRTAELLQASDESDPRVVANAVEALWGADSADAHASLLDAAESRHPRVLGNALLGLFQIGDTAAIRRIQRLAAHPDPRFRATAAWVMERTRHPRFLPVLAALVRESDPRARSRVFRALAALKRVSDNLATARPLRVHILSVSGEANSLRTLQAVIAACDGSDSGVSATGLVVSENGRPIEDLKVRRPEPPGPIALGLFLPNGDPCDRILAVLSGMRREHDRWSPVRYAPGATLQAILPVLAFLGAVSGPRHAFIYADELGDESAEACTPIIAQARGCSAAIHSVSRSGAAFPHGPLLAEKTGGRSLTIRNIDELRPAGERLYLALFRLYEVSYRVGEPAVTEIKLEAYSSEACGADVFQVRPS